MTRARAVALAGGRALGTWLATLKDGEGGSLGAVVSRRVDADGVPRFYVVTGVEVWRFGRKIMELRAGDEVTDRVVDVWGERRVESRTVPCPASSSCASRPGGEP
jgi:hypothetical protein